jgi:hypothetical protein
MEGLILSVGVAIVVVFLKLKVRRLEHRIDRLEKSKGWQMPLSRSE